jgi:hypothetical protein
VMNNDTLDLGEREGDQHVGGAVGGTAAAIGCHPTADMQGEGGGSIERCSQSKVPSMVQPRVLLFSPPEFSVRSFSPLYCAVGLQLIVNR